VPEQFHFDPDSYLDLVRAEVPAYERLQDAVAEAAREVRAASILDLGTGTGETLRRVAAPQPGARLVGIDESRGMLALAQAMLPAADLRVRQLQDDLPDGPFDLVISALAVHHLDAAQKADLFTRVASRLTPTGRFVLGDVIMPEDARDRVTPIDGTHDTPDRIDEQLDWLMAAGFTARLWWVERDLAVLVGDRHPS
jgi:tRNA (cmo5U34)-methyltransferase